jgi:hypothetical protein
MTNHEEDLFLIGDSCLAGKEGLEILWNTLVHYSVVFKPPTFTYAKARLKYP